jgi:hypothetical protein
MHPCYVADPKPQLCVVTNKRAEYRHPLTNLPYVDKKAYHIIQARLEAARQAQMLTQAHTSDSMQEDADVDVDADVGNDGGEDASHNMEKHTSSGV